jgi:hypothetical protein
MRSKPDIHFSIESENYKKLSAYINALQSTKISPENVGEIDIDSYVELEKQIKIIQEKYSKRTKELEKQHLTEVSSIKAEMQKQISSLKTAYKEAFAKIKESASPGDKQIENVQSDLEEKIVLLETDFNAKLEEIAKEYQAKVEETKNECNKNVLATIKEAITKLGTGAIGVAGAVRTFGTTVLQNPAIQTILIGVIRQIAPTIAEGVKQVTLELINQVLGA